MSVTRTPYGPSTDEDDDAPAPRDLPLLAAGVKWYAADDLLLGAKAFVCGGAAGAVSKTVVAPLERVKIKLQVAAVISKQQSALQIYSNIVREEGFTALWRGNTANVVRVIPNKGILFMCNDLYMKKLQEPGKPLTDTQRIIAGTMSGATIVMLTYPLDICQTRLASSSKSEFRGIFDCMSKTVATEGVHGLYRGFWASMFGVAPYTGAQFFAYAKLNQFAADRAPKNPQTGKPEVGVLTKLFCGAAAGLLAQSITFPTDTIRRRLQVQGLLTSGRAEYSGMLDCIAKVYAKEGVRGFYHGAWVNALKSVPSAAIQFYVYNALKDLLGVQGGGSGA